MMRRTLAFLVAAVMLSACGNEKKIEKSFYLPPDTPANVLKNLQVSYLKRNSAEYGKLLADDFRFYLDEGTRQENSNLPVFWTRVQDSTQTEALFSATSVTDIRILLQFGEPRPAQELGRPDWVYIDVLDTFLEVDLAPKPGESEGLTLRIDGQRQRFYFRKGGRPEDTASKDWYITEWIDYGMERKSVLNSIAGSGSENSLSSFTTWSRIKSLS